MSTGVILHDMPFPTMPKVCVVQTPQTTLRGLVHCEAIQQQLLLHYLLQRSFNKQLQRRATFILLPINISQTVLLLCIIIINVGQKSRQPPRQDKENYTKFASLTCNRNSCSSALRARQTERFQQRNSSASSWRLQRQLKHKTQEMFPIVALNFMYNVNFSGLC